MSSMQTISVQVTPEAARIYRNASASQRKKMELLMSLRLLEASASSKSLETIMPEINHSAQERGLTDEPILPAAPVIPPIALPATDGDHT